MDGRNLVSQWSSVDIKIRKATLEWVVLVGMLIFSLINSITLLIFLISCLLLLNQKEIGAIKILNIITLRTIINPGIGLNIARWQNFKWLIIFICSFYLLAAYFKLTNEQRKKINPIIYFVLLFSVYNMVASLFFSTLPTVAFFKLASYVTVFLGIFVGIAYTGSSFDWLNWNFRLFSILILASLPLKSMPVGYLVNGYGFQGLTNQPNMFGIFAALFIGLLVTKVQMNKMRSKISIAMWFSITMYMILISRSRTGFIACIVLLIAYFVYANINKLMKAICINTILIIAAFNLLMDSKLVQFLVIFISKGQEKNILYSRLLQVESFISNFLRSPWFGNGFAVPVTSFRSFAFSTNYLVEPGNLILSVLSYSGIIGFLIFTLYMFMIFLQGIKNYKKTIYLPMAAILISMGEMVFFSSNNIGIWCYMMISLYVFANDYCTS